LTEDKVISEILFLFPTQIRVTAHHFLFIHPLICIQLGATGDSRKLGCAHSAPVLVSQSVSTFAEVHVIQYSA